MLTSGELRHAYRVAVNEWLDDNAVAGDDAHDAGLRAVEAAVRAALIEAKVAAIEIERPEGEPDGDRYLQGYNDALDDAIAIMRAQLSVPVTPGGNSNG